MIQYLILEGKFFIIEVMYLSVFLHRDRSRDIIENRVRIPDGTAAVSIDARISVGESQSPVTGKAG